MDDTQLHHQRLQPRGSANAIPRRRPSWRRRVLVVLFVVVAVALAGALLLWLRLASFNDAVSTEPALSSRLMAPLGGSERVTVLLLGHSPEGRDGAFLSDSLTLLSIEPDSDTTTSISIPRDLWIEGVPALPANGKVNEAFAVGYRAGGYPAAGNLVTEVVSTVTGVDIDGWIALDFDGFREMVDAVGGITVENRAAFRWAMGPDEHAAGQWVGSYPVGEVQLDGLGALRYARARYTDSPAESSDFARGARQQLILAAVRNRITFDPPGIPRALALADALEGHLKTNLSIVDLVMLAEHVSPDRRVILEEGVVVEATRNSIGQYVLVVIGRMSPSDYRPLHDHLAHALASSSDD